MIKFALKGGDHSAAPADAAVQDEHIAPVPRISIQAFCASPETAAAMQAASEDRRMTKAHLKVQMGGIAAATEAYRASATPNVVIIESDGRGEELLERPRYARRGVRRRHARDRGRPSQRHRAVSRDGAARRQRLPDRAGRTGRPDPRDIRPVLRGRREAGRTHARGGRRKGRRRCLDGRAQHRMGDRTRRASGRGGGRPRSAVRHRRPRLQPGSAAGHRGRRDVAGPHRYRLCRPAAVKMHRSPEPAGGARDARSGL